MTALPAFSADREWFGDGWSFHVGDLSPASGPIGSWRPVSLPHDWSIEGATAPTAASGGGGGFFPTGTGWYRKVFEAPEAWLGKDVSLLFEGVYRDATVFLNGVELVRHAYGYTPFRVSIGPHLHLDRPNLLEVRVANEPQPNSRWYTGSGIYRPVWLEVRPEVHFAPESLVAVTREISPAGALLDLEVALSGVSELGEDGRIVFTLGEGPDAVATTVGVPKGWKDAKPIHARLTVPNPRLWSPDSPSLYPLEVALYRGEDCLERLSERIGLRTIRLSVERGFLLNGEPVILLGGNVHHDNGPLGAAAFGAAERRKARLLKDAGFNAVRTAHNPPSTAFLRACDELGLLVLDESFDAWKSKKTDHDYGEIFDANWEADLRAMVLRDRNHPSVVMWSIGNEVYERGNDSGVARAHAMAATVRQLDRNRPVTIGLNGLGESGDWTRLDAIFDALDAAGYNYELHRHAEDHARRPNRMIFSAESYLSDTFADWKMCQENAYVIGDFVWSAIDYLGEAGIGRVFPPDEEARAHWIGDHYPWHGAACGDIDLTGWRKPVSHYRNIVWDRGETLYAAVTAPTPDGRPWNNTLWSIDPALPSWTWPGSEGRELTVQVYSRHPSVRLFLNDSLVGEAATTAAEEFKAIFAVPYAPGRLEVRAGDETLTLDTAGTPARLAFTESSVRLDPSDEGLAFVTVEIVDAQGVPHPLADRPIRFSASDGAEILAIGSGDLASTESYRANPRRSFQGRAIAIVRVDPDAGDDVTVTAAAEGLASATARIRVTP